MEGTNVSVRFCGQCIVPNEKGELEFESGAGTKTQIHAEELERVMLYSQSLEEALDYLQGSGAYIGAQDSRMMVFTASNGTIIFSKDEPSRKTVIDKDVPESVIQQILAINNYDDERAVEKILIENGIIEDPEKETEQVLTSDIDNKSFEREADNVDSRDVTDGGMIGEARSARDSIEDPDRGIYSEEARRRMEEERMKKIREGRAADKDEGFDR